MAFAIDEGRVLIVNGSFLYVTPNEHCPTRGLECFFYPITNCSLTDVPLDQVFIDSFLYLPLFAVSVCLSSAHLSQAVLAKRDTPRPSPARVIYAPDVYGLQLTYVPRKYAHKGGGSIFLHPACACLNLLPQVRIGGKRSRPSTFCNLRSGCANTSIFSER
jgi:hypothetical protein